ncbi:hypothetical protein GCM10010232_36320 [Streptomyces amakusaensis]
MVESNVPLLAMVFGQGDRAHGIGGYPVHGVGIRDNAPALCVEVSRASAAHLSDAYGGAPGSREGPGGADSGENHIRPRAGAGP